MGNTPPKQNQPEWPKFEHVSPNELTKLHRGDHIVWQVPNRYFQDAIVVNVNTEMNEITYLYYPYNKSSYRYTFAETSNPFSKYEMLYIVRHPTEFPPDEVLRRAIACEINLYKPASRIYKNFETYCKTGEKDGSLCSVCSENTNKFEGYKNYEVTSICQIQRADYIIFNSNGHHSHAIVLHVDEAKQRITVVSCSVDVSVHIALEKIDPFDPSCEIVYRVTSYQESRPEESNEVIHRAIGREWKVLHCLQTDYRDYAIKCKTEQFDANWFCNFHRRLIKPEFTDENLTKYKKVKNINDIKTADHIKWKRMPGYDHHAIVKEVHPAVMKITIVHYQKVRNSNDSTWEISIDTVNPIKQIDDSFKDDLFKDDSFKDDLFEDDLFIVNHENSVSDENVIRRAIDHLGKMGGNFMACDSEKFAIWFKTGQQDTRQ